MSLALNLRSVGTTLLALAILLSLLVILGTVMAPRDPNLAAHFAFLRDKEMMKYYCFAASFDIGDTGAVRASVTASAIAIDDDVLDSMFRE